jgi:hypothetical protein
MGVTHKEIMTTVRNDVVYVDQHNVEVTVDVEPLNLWWGYIAKHYPVAGSGPDEATAREHFISAFRIYSREAGL